MQMGAQDVSRRASRRVYPGTQSCPALSGAGSRRRYHWHELICESVYVKNGRKDCSLGAGGRHAFSVA